MRVLDQFLIRVIVNLLDKWWREPSWSSNGINKRLLFRLFLKKISFRFLYELLSSVFYIWFLDIGTHVRTCLSIRDFNPKATKMINLDVALIDQRNSRREPIPKEADKVCTICQDKLIGTGGVNSLRCSHKYHHLCIVEWIRHNLSCPTCRDTEI